MCRVEMKTDHIKFNLKKPENIDVEKVLIKDLSEIYKIFGQKLKAYEEMKSLNARVTAVKMHTETENVTYTVRFNNYDDLMDVQDVLMLIKT